MVTLDETRQRRKGTRRHDGQGYVPDHGGMVDMVSGDKVLVCRECEHEFKFSQAEREFYEQKGFSNPARCPECRKARHEVTIPRYCSQCGTELKAAPIFCSTCLKNVELEFEMKTKQMQKTTNEAFAKLKAAQFEKTELVELLRQKEKLARNLELKVETLTQELEKVNQMYATLNRWFQPTLNEIEKGLTQRLGALEQGQNRINEGMLQITQRMHEMCESITLLELIKRKLRGYQR